ncbi:MAG: type II toxin-antitoxin system PemK/MazF family toxin [Gammaproteobacteria bacterium]
MKRGDLVTLALPGAYGKLRPALIVQSDLFDAHPSVTVLPVTSELRDLPLFRIRVQPSQMNGLRAVSEVMVDKAHTLMREKVGPRIGRLVDEEITAVNRALATFLGFA